MISVNLIYDHRNRGGETGPVEVRIIHQRRPYYINTGVRVRRREWKNGCVVNRSDGVELNERLERLCRRINEEVNACIDEQREIDVAEIKRKVWGVKSPAVEKPKSTMLDWVAEQLPMLHLSQGTYKHYVCTYEMLCKFGAIETWEDVTVENLYKFDAWIRQRPAQSGEGTICGATVYNYHKQLKSLLNRAVRFGVIRSNPYDRLRGQFKRCDNPTVEYLTEDEVASIMQIEMDEGTMLARSRDLFVFQLYTGLSYSDTQAFDISSYRKVKGVWTCTIPRIKTGVPFVCQLLPPAVEVLEKYGWKVPRIDAADYNHMLKAVGAMAHISTRMHSHLARHTFATYMLRHGVRIENVSKMLGHTNITQTQRYAKVLAESVHEDYERINQLLTNNAQKQ